MSMWKVIVGAVLVGVLGAGAWFYMSGGMAEMRGGESGERLMEGATATDPNSLESGTWRSLMGMTSAARCTVSTTANGVESMGTVYVANGSMRGDFSSTVNGRAVDSHIIADATTVYTWSTGLPQGVKTPRDLATGQTSGNSTETFNPNAELNYSCGAWTADASMFVPPTDITFLDISAMMQVGIPEMQ